MSSSNSYISTRLKIALSAIIAVAIINQPAHAVCVECGTVTDVKTVKVEGHGSGLGIVAGGVVGGILGHQVGGGVGNDLATIGGAAGGAYVGNQVEKKSKAKTKYKVIVQMEDGAIKTFKYSSKTSYQVGDRVKVINGNLTRQ